MQPRALAGAVGLARDRVHTSKGVLGCAPALPVATEAAARSAADQVGAGLGRGPDMVIAAGTLGWLALPSGAMGGGGGGENASLIFERSGRQYVLWPEAGKLPPRVVTTEAGEGLRADFQRFYPLGLARVKNGAVTGEARHGFYDVLPQEAGLIQLLEAGAIEVPAVVSRSAGMRAFRVLRPIPRFPAGLVGSHAADFRLAQDVPLPPGNPGSSSVRGPDGACLLPPGRCR